MKITTRPLIAGGAALVGASMIAMPAATFVADSDATAPRTVQADVALASWGAGWLGWGALNNPATSDAKVAEQGFRRVVEQFVQYPVIPLTVAANLATGDNYGLYQVGKQLIDSPLYVADPFLVLADRNNLLPGGETAVSLHNKAWADRQSTYQDLAKVLGYPTAPAGDHNETFSGVRTLVLDPIVDAPAKLRAALSDPEATLQAVRTGVKLSVAANVAKTKANLGLEKVRVNRVIDKLKDADPIGALKQVGDNMKDRAKQVRNEIRAVQKTIGGRSDASVNSTD